jgi:hypothetical protein
VPLLVDGGGSTNASALQAEPPVQGSCADRIEVVLRNGRLLRVASAADPGAIARLAAALEA